VAEEYPRLKRLRNVPDKNFDNPVIIVLRFLFLQQRGEKYAEKRGNS
jgi:hypothetical protein